MPAKPKEAEIPVSAAATGKASSSQGFVLLIVLWWSVMIAFLATQIVTATRTALLLSSNMRASTDAETQADGAANAAIFQILSQNWKADGTIHVITGPRGVVEVRIDDEGEKIDPNVAPAVLLQALLQECGAATKTASDLATAIYEWRSIDLLRSSGSADARYRAARCDYLPPHARFVRQDELGLVLGMTSDLLACITPHISVHGLTVPSLQTTSDPVVRQALGNAYPYDTLQMVAATVREVAVVRITAIARQTDGGRFGRIAVVRVVPAEPNQDFIYRILSWKKAAG